MSVVNSQFPFLPEPDSFRVRGQIPPLCQSVVLLCVYCHLYPIYQLYIHLIHDQALVFTCRSWHRPIPPSRVTGQSTSKFAWNATIQYSGRSTSSASVSASAFESKRYRWIGGHVIGDVARGLRIVCFRRGSDALLKLRAQRLSKLGLHALQGNRI